MKNKIITLMCIIAFGTSTLFAESGVCGDNLTWTFENGVLTISGDGGMSNYNYRGPWEPLSNNIKKVVISEGVTSIGRSAFYDCNSLTSVTIPYSVTIIGNYAFMGCNSLYSVEIPNSVTSIGDRSFKDCSSLTSITIPYSVTSIGDNAFKGCASLTSVAILNEEIRVGDNIFENCSLQEILCPKGLDLSHFGIPTKTRKIEFVFPKSKFENEELSIPDGYIDLDLPSKTLWKTQDEEDIYSFDRAIESFGKELPTKEQWKELRNSCKWIWKDNGYQVIGRNGNTIFLSATNEVFSCGGQRGYLPGEPKGYYWSGTQDDRWALAISFNKNEIFLKSCGGCEGKSIRLVKPSGFVDLGLPSGTLWRNSNEWEYEGEVLRDVTFKKAKKYYGSYLPTKEQWQELIDECTWTWVDPGEWIYYEDVGIYEREGDLPFYIVIGKNGNTITLPVVGYIDDESYTCIGCGTFGEIETGNYYSSSETKDKTFYIMYFDDSEQDLQKLDPDGINNFYSIRLVY